MFKIENGRMSFYQWDLDQRLIVEDASITEVHFCNRTDDCSLVCEVFEENGKRLVNVPNILLQDNWTIRVYAYCANYTKIEEKFNVFSRSKPADYIYTETEIKNYDDLAERITQLEESTGVNIDLGKYALKTDIPSVEGLASTEYVDDAIANIDIPTSGGEKEWKRILDITIPEENASRTLFVTQDEDGNALDLTEVSIVWQGIQLTNGDKDCKAWISLNGKKAGYNCGKWGYMTNSYFAYTNNVNYTRSNYARKIPNQIFRESAWDSCIDDDETINAIELSVYAKDTGFYGRVVIYGR